MTWKIDYAHSHLQFTVRHMMIAKVRGEFERFTGNIDFDEANPANTTADIRIEVASLNTRDDQRDGHLRSPDFLDADNCPVMTFVSKRVDIIDDEHARLYGDLSIRGASREVALDVSYEGKAKSPWGTTSVGLSATTTINRKDWGLNWNVALETGGFLVGDKIRIDIELELVEQPEAESEVTA